MLQLVDVLLPLSGTSASRAWSTLRTTRPTKRPLSPSLRRRSGSQSTCVPARVLSRARLTQRPLLVPTQEWGTNTSQVQHLYDPIEQMLEKEAPHIHERYPKTWSTSTHVGRHLRNILLSEELCKLRFFVASARVEKLTFFPLRSRIRRLLQGPVARRARRIR